MERSPRKVEDKDTQWVFDFIFRNSFGNPIVLTGVPTAATLKANTWGYFGTDIYIKFADATTLKFSGSTVA